MKPSKHVMMVVVVLLVAGIIAAVVTYFGTKNKSPRVSISAHEEGTTTKHKSEIKTVGISTTGQVYIIRHGEKTFFAGCLSATGTARAAELPNIFSTSNASNTFSTPKAIFAMHYGDIINCERTAETVKPLAQNLSLPVNEELMGGVFNNNGGNRNAARIIKEELMATGGPVLAAWEHLNIQYLVRDLGVNPEEIDNWPGNDFDSVYVLTYSLGSGTPILKSFEMITQGQGFGARSPGDVGSRATFIPFLDGAPI
jgi:hypothetical protein